MAWDRVLNMNPFHKNLTKSSAVVRPLAKIKLCERCGQEFLSNNNRKKKCDSCRDWITLTEYDKKVYRDFCGVCKRIGLKPQRAFVLLTGVSQSSRFEFLRIGYKLSEVEKDRYTFILNKFVVDLRAGMYDIVYEPTLTVMNYKKHLVRRMEPRPKVCPCHISSCAGAFYAGECPRNYNQCEMSRKVQNRNPTYSRDLAMLVRKLVDDERSNREASIAGRTGPD